MRDFDKEWNEARLKLANYAIRITKNPTLAEDLLQDTCIRCWKAYPRFDGKAKFGVWAVIVMKRLHIDAGRSRIPKCSSYDAPATTEDGEADLLNLLPSPFNLHDLVADLIEADDLSRMLTPLEHSMMTKKAFGLSDLEIGESMGIPAGTVKSRIWRLKERVRGEYANV